MCGKPVVPTRNRKHTYMTQIGPGENKINRKLLNGDDDHLDSNIEAQYLNQNQHRKLQVLCLSTEHVMLKERLLIRCL